VYHLLLIRIGVGVVEVDTSQRNLRVYIIAGGVLDGQVPALSRYAIVGVCVGEYLCDPALTVGRERS
jgi:hypothetical protein